MWKFLPAKGVVTDVTSTTIYRSPALDLPAAVGDTGHDAGVAAHYGEPIKEQRELLAGRAATDLSHRDVVRISGPDRLEWLHTLTTQFFSELPAWQATSGLVLDANGRVQHAFDGVDDGSAFWLHTEPGAAASLVEYLVAMRFWSDVEVSDETAEVAVVHERIPESTSHPARVTEHARDVFVPRPELLDYLRSTPMVAGAWAFEALRIADGTPRLRVDTDEKAIPNEMNWLGSAVHLDKGCYRGQETVARVHNLGRPPRRLTLLHLDGTEERLPEIGADIKPADKEGARPTGRVGSSAQHHELGPIALALVKRSVPVDAPLLADGIPANQEAVVDPDIGLHVRPTLS